MDIEACPIERRKWKNGWFYFKENRFYEIDERYMDPRLEGKRVPRGYRVLEMLDFPERWGFAETTDVPNCEKIWLSVEKEFPMPL